MLNVTEPGAAGRLLTSSMCSQSYSLTERQEIFLPSGVEEWKKHDRGRLGVVRY